MFHICACMPPPVTGTVCRPRLVLITMSTYRSPEQLVKLIHTMADGADVTLVFVEDTGPTNRVLAHSVILKLHSEVIADALNVEKSQQGQPQVVTVNRTQEGSGPHCSSSGGSNIVINVPGILCASKASFMQLAPFM